MKYKAIATIVLLLLPLIPLAFANQPTPPTWNVEFRILPHENKFWGPCIVSTDFTKDVYLWNDKTLTGKGVYAFDFYVWWINNKYFNLTGATAHIPWPDGSYFIVKNEVKYNAVGSWNYYHLAVTAVGNSTINPALELGATGLFNASVLTLNFHINDEPCWPDWVKYGFFIGNENGAQQVDEWTDGINGDPAYYPDVSTGCGVKITNLEVINAWVYIFSSQPNIDPLYNGGYYFAEDAIGESYTITVALSNITKAYGFKFTLTWNSSWYDTDIQHVTILPAFAPPYELLTMVMGDGYLTIELKRPCEKPAIHAAGYLPVVDVTFVTTNEPMVGIVPSAYNTTFTIVNPILYVKCDTVEAYTPQNGLLVSGPVIQAFIPKSRADITIDGVVDIEDLAALAEEYGNVHPWSDLALPGYPSPVDIFDLVYVAKRYGDP